MRLIFIYGMPAPGKLTVAQELAKLIGYKLFHNHLVVDLLLLTNEFGSATFVRLREKIWLGFFLIQRHEPSSRVIGRNTLGAGVWS